MIAETGYKPGQRLRVRTLDPGDHETPGKKIEEVTVIKQYPHFILVQNDRGKRWCITNAEIYCARSKALFGDRGKPQEKERTKYNVQQKK